MSGENVVYLENRGLGGENDYSIEITTDGVTVYSECCADRMSDEVAEAVHAALGRYLDARRRAARVRIDAAGIRHQFHYRRAYPGNGVVFDEMCSCGWNDGSFNGIQAEHELFEAWLGHIPVG